jgi:hypothetical protein
VFDFGQSTICEQRGQISYKGGELMKEEEEEEELYRENILFKISA